MRKILNVGEFESCLNKKKIIKVGGERIIRLRKGKYNYIFGGKFD